MYLVLDFLRGQGGVAWKLGVWEMIYVIETTSLASMLYSRMCPGLLVSFFLERQ